MIPTLFSKRLILRPYRESDAKNVQRLAGKKVIAEMTANIPHPYLDGMAEDWISNHISWFENRTAVTLAILLADSGIHIGTISITQIDGTSGNLGYWIGVPFWGKGYCSEATDILLKYGFEDFGLDLVYALHLPENPASGKVMTKNGFVYTTDIQVGEKLLLHYELSKTLWLQSQCESRQ